LSSNDTILLDVRTLDKDAMTLAVKQLKEMDEEEKQTVKKGIKAGLESLQGKIPGLLSIHVQTEGLPSSNADIMLDSSFENADALKGYATHPEHVKIADGNVRPYTQNRVCMDYEV